MYSHFFVLSFFMLFANSISSCFLFSFVESSILPLLCSSLLLFLLKELVYFQLLFLEVLLKVGYFVLHWGMRFAFGSDVA